MFRIFSIALLLVSATAAFAANDALTSGAWQALREGFYGNREFGEVDEKLMSMTAPGSTPDPSATPVTINFGGAALGHVRQMRVIIDHNPSPVAATMKFEQGVPIDQIGLRLRIDRETSVRAIAELDNGSLEMRSVWIRASGGCSAPPSAGGPGKIGDVRFRPTPDGKSLQVSLRHPNNSGFQIDPVSGDPIPPHFVQHVRIRAGGRTLLDIDTGISLSENPTIRIASTEKIPAPLTFEAVDSEQADFQATWTGAVAQSGAP